MKPAFKIIADGADVTAKIADRLLSLTIVDEDGYKSDRLTLQLDDRDYKLEMPETDVPLDVSLGFKGEPLTYIGRYVVDGLSGEGPVATMSIEATAANMVIGIRAPKTRPWHEVSLSDIVSKIAGEAGLRPIVGQSLQGVTYVYQAQTAESDLHFLTRLARDLDATAKPAGGSLLVQKRGEGLNAEGEKVEPAAINARRLSSWTWERDDREVYKSVEAEWGDVDGAKTNKVTAGSGEPVHRLRHPYATKSEAQRAADAELALSGRAVVTIDGEIAGFEPAIFAGGQIQTSGLRAELNGLCHVTSVTHQLDTALVTNFTAQIAQS